MSIVEIVDHVHASQDGIAENEKWCTRGVRLDEKDAGVVSLAVVRDRLPGLGINDGNNELISSHIDRDLSRELQLE